MKKLLSLALLLFSLGFIAAPGVDAKTSDKAVSPDSTANAVATAPQRGRYRRFPPRYNGRVSVTTQTRLVRVGRQVYRETYQVRYQPNGRTQTRLISRVRVR